MKVNRRHELFPDVSDEDWYNWKWQVRNRIENVEDLKKLIPLSQEEEEGAKTCLKQFRMAITPYYLSLIDPNDPFDPVRAQSIPTADELHRDEEDLVDPLHEDVDFPVPGLTHRYPDRVLMLISETCSMVLSSSVQEEDLRGHHDLNPSIEHIDQAIEYIRQTPQVRDVLLSGGDPFLLSDKRIEYILKNLREIPHVEIIRIGT